MTRILYDAVSPSNIPSSAQIVAGYANGYYNWTAADWDRFSKVPRATIDVTGTRYYSDVLDVEAGDASVATAVAWVKKKWEGKIIYPPVIYCNRSTLTSLFNAMNAAGFEIVKHFRLWVGTLDGTKTLGDMTGVTAVQYHDAGGYDQSIVYDDSWKPGTPQTPVTPPPTVLYDTLEQRKKAVTSTDGGKTWH